MESSNLQNKTKDFKEKFNNFKWKSKSTKKIGKFKSFSYWNKAFKKDKNHYLNLTKIQ